MNIFDGCHGNIIVFVHLESYTCHTRATKSSNGYSSLANPYLRCSTSLGTSGDGRRGVHRSLTQECHPGLEQESVAVIFQLSTAV